MAEQAEPSPLVVVGASAGGIEALSTLVSSLAANFPAPLVIAQHLDPSRPSILGDILARHTTLPVRLMTGHAPLEGGVIFVVPANHHVEITNDALNLPVDDRGRLKPSIDRLFSSAVAAWGDNLIAVVLTGTGVDGCAGARAVKHAGGMVIVQNPSTAQYGGMPAAAEARHDYHGRGRCDAPAARGRPRQHHTRRPGATVESAPSLRPRGQVARIPIGFLAPPAA